MNFLYIQKNSNVKTTDVFLAKKSFQIQILNKRKKLLLSSCFLLKFFAQKKPKKPKKIQLRKSKSNCPHSMKSQPTDHFFQKITKFIIDYAHFKVVVVQLPWIFSSVFINSNTMPVSLSCFCDSSNKTADDNWRVLSSYNSQRAPVLFCKQDKTEIYFSAVCKRWHFLWPCIETW